MDLENFLRHNFTSPAYRPIDLRNRDKCSLVFPLHSSNFRNLGTLYSRGNCLAVTLSEYGGVRSKVVGAVASLSCSFLNMVFTSAFVKGSADSSDWHVCRLAADRLLKFVGVTSGRVHQ